jgi:hypothetical protein
MIDRTGKVYGRLTVVGLAAIEAGHAKWYCRCECGRTVVVPGSNLGRGKTRSCSCLKMEARPQLTHGHAGKQLSPTYYSWQCMRHRCTNSKYKGYRWYGGKGITFDPRWKDFRVFLADVGERPTRKHTLHRLSHDRNYEPGNVCWSTDHKEVA